MSIEYKFQLIVLQTEDIQEYFPGLMSMINSSLPKRKRSYRKRRKKKTVGPLIKEIIDSLE